MTAAQEPGRLLIFYAFARELAHFRRRLEARSALTSEGLRGLRGRLGGADLTLIATGIGTARARQTARRALEVFPGTNLIISAGVAGALSEGLRPGDLVLADRLMLGGQESSCVAHILPLEPEQVRAAEHALRAAGLRFTTGAMLTASRVLVDGAAKRVAKEQSGAIAVDMESAVLGLETAAHGIPFVCVRAVLDAVDDEVPAAELGGADGRVRPLAATTFLIRHPATLLKLPRLMRNLSRATASLAEALDALTRHRTPR
ncbi:MAG: hypothetical protein ACHQZS_12855 [Candidatus Binatales bacterium]